jgi:hypothetical protein
MVLDTLQRLAFVMRVISPRILSGSGSECVSDKTVCALGQELLRKTTQALSEVGPFGP